MTSTFLNQVTTRRRGRRLCRDERGQSAVELAVVLPFVLLLLLGVMDFGKAFNYWITESQVTSDTARHLVVTPSMTSISAVKTYALGDISIKQLHDNATVCVGFPNGTENIGDPVKVTIRFSYAWLPFLTQIGHVSSFTLRRSATMRLEQTSTFSPVVQTGDGTCA